MALKVGQLYVAVTTKMDLTGLMKATGKIVSEVQKVGDKLKRLGRDAGALGVRLGAAIGAAVAVAAQHNEAVAAEVQRAKDAMAAFGTEIGKMLLPTLKATADEVGRLVNWFRSLSPETKDQIASFLKWGLVLAAVGSAVGKIGTIISIAARSVSLLLPLIEGLAGGLAAVGGLVVDGLGAALAALTAPIAGTVAIVAGIAAAIVAIGFGVYKAWTNDWGGIQEKVRAVGAWLKEHLTALWQAIVMGFKMSWKVVGDYILDPFTKAFGWIRDTFFGGITKLLDTLSSAMKNHPLLAKSLGAIGIDQDTLAFMKDFAGWGQHLLTADGMKEIGSQAVELGKSVGSAVASGVRTGVAAAGEAIGKLKDKVKGWLPDLSKYSTNVGPLGKLKEFDVGSPDISGNESFDFLFGLQTSKVSEVMGALDQMRKAHIDDLRNLEAQLRPAEQLGKQMALVRELYDAGRIDQKTYYGQLIDYLDQTSQGFKAMHDAASAVTTDMAQGFMELTQGVEGAFGKMVQSILADLEKLAVNKTFEGLLNLGMQALAGAFASGTSVDPTGQGGVVGGGIASTYGVDALRAAPIARTSGAVHAPMMVNITVQSDGSVSGDTRGGESTQMQRFAKGLQAAIKRHLQDEMRPGGDIYRFATGSR